MVAEDNAISDTVYFLSKALNSERIDLATFMKVSGCRFLGVDLTYLDVVYSYAIKRTIHETCFDQKDNPGINNKVGVRVYMYAFC